MKLKDWEQNLNSYIEENRNKPFEWGVHDCLTFANGACKAMTGKGFTNYGGVELSAREALDQYQAFMRDTKFLGAADVLDQWLTRKNGYPSRGDIVARKTDRLVVGVSMGVCIGRHIAFLDREKMAFLLMKKGDLVWEI